MEIILKNDRLRAVVSSLGGELRSLQTHDGCEYLWQGEAPYWQSRAPLLFPFIGRLTNKTYTLDETCYSMEIHGFFRTSALTLLSQSDERAAFMLRFSEESMAFYPRRFEANLTYAVEGASVQIGFRVINLDEKPMYFGYGGHPGFRVPLEEGLTFADYRLRFAAPCAPTLVGVSDDCFIEKPDLPYPLEDGQILPLRHSLFDRDALIFCDVPRAVTLESAGGTRSVTVAFPGMRYLGVWHDPRTKAPFVCLEPWTSLPAYQGVIEAFEQKEDLISLPPGKEYRCDWSIALGV